MNKYEIYGFFQHFQKVSRYFSSYFGNLQKNIELFSKFLKKARNYFCVHTSLIIVIETSIHQFGAAERANQRLSPQVNPRFWSHRRGCFNRD